MNINNNYLKCPLCQNLFLTSLVRFHYENCKKKHHNHTQLNNNLNNNSNHNKTIQNQTNIYQQYLTNLKNEEKKREIEKLRQIEYQRKVEREREIERLKQIEQQKKIEREREIERLKQLEQQKKVDIEKEMNKIRQLENQKRIEREKEIERIKQLEIQKRIENERLKMIEYKKESEKIENEKNIIRQNTFQQNENKGHNDNKENNKYECTQVERYIKPEIVSYNDNMLNHFFKQYEKLFIEYVSGKCIALVGPAESIIGTNKGSVIDKFDLVVRLNKSIPLPSKMKDDIGTRTDIVYNSMNTSDFPGENNLSTRLYKKHGVRYVCSSYPFNHNIFHDDILHYVKKYKFDLPLKVIDDMKFKGLEKVIGTRPYTGTCAIMDLLSYPIKYLYITGLDFYHSKYYGEYRHMSKEGQKYTRNNNIHKAKPQLEYLKNLSLIDDRIILDDFLDKLLYHDYYKVIKHLKSFDTDKIFQFGDEYFKQYFEMKISDCIYTKTPTINKKNIKFDNNILVITDNKYYNKNNNEYCLFMTHDKGLLNALNSNLESKKFIGNFFYTKNIHNNPSIYISDKFLLHIKNNVQRVGITNCNVNLAILLSIVMYLPEKHFFSYNEILNGWKMNAEEKKLVLFMIKKKILKII